MSPRTLALGTACDDRHTHSAVSRCVLPQHSALVCMRMVYAYGVCVCVMHEWHCARRWRAMCCTVLCIVFQHACGNVMSGTVRWGNAHASEFRWPVALCIDVIIQCDCYAWIFLADTEKTEAIGRNVMISQRRHDSGVCLDFKGML